MIGTGFFADSQKNFERNRELKSSFKHGFREDVDEFIRNNIHHETSDDLTWRTCSKKEMDRLKSKIRYQAKLDRIKAIGIVILSTFIVASLGYSFLN